MTSGDNSEGIILRQVNRCEADDWAGFFLTNCYTNGESCRYRFNGDCRGTVYNLGRLFKKIVKSFYRPEVYPLITKIEFLFRWTVEYERQWEKYGYRNFWLKFLQRHLLASISCEELLSIPEGIYLVDEGVVGRLLVVDVSNKEAKQVEFLVTYVKEVHEILFEDRSNLGLERACRVIFEKVREVLLTDDEFRVKSEGQGLKFESLEEMLNICTRKG